MYQIIVNPTSGRGRAVKAVSVIEAYLTGENVPFETRYTEAPGHATQLALEAADASRDGIISMGGDGTIREIAAALSGRETPILIVPCGTGNDLAKTMKLPKDPLAALKLQLKSGRGAIDVGHVCGHVFVNASGTGLDVDVLKNTLKHKSRFSGIIPYLLGVFDAIKTHKPIQIELHVKDAIIKKRVAIIEITNGQYIGGGMRVAPTADLKDGLFDIYYVDALSRPLIVLLLPFFVTGLYRILPCTHVLYASELSIHSGGMTMNIDGDLIDIENAHYSITPMGLRTHI